jgi:O-antigen/teichoic acid export membrane protein
MDDERRTLLKGYLAALSGLIVLQASQLFTGALLARVFPEADLFGRVSLVQQVAGMAGLLLSLGIDAALIYDVSRGRDTRTSFGVAFRSSAWYSAGLTGLLIATAPLIARLYGAPAMVPELTAGALGLLPAGLTGTAQSVLIGWGRFGSQAIVTVASQVAGALGLAAGALLYPSSPAVAAFLVSAGASMLVASVTLRFVAREGHLRLALWGPMAEWPRMARYGIPIWIGNFFKAYQGPLIIIAAGTASLSEAGYLSNAFRLAGFAGVVTWGFMIVTLPFVSSSPPGEHARRANLCLRYNLYALLPVASLIALHARELTTWLFGPQFAAAAAYLPVVTAGVLVSGLARLSSQCLAGAGKPKVTAVILFLPGAVVGLLAPLLVPRLPAAGAWLFLAAWSLSAVAALRLLPRHGLPLRRSTLLRPAAATAPLVGAILFGQWLGAPWHLPLLLLGLFSTAFAVWRQESDATDGKRLESK